MPAASRRPQHSDRDGDRHRDRHHATSAPQTINVTVNEQADAPTLSASAAVAHIDEGGSVALNITATGGGDRPGRHLTVTISGFPADATLTNTARRPADHHGRQHHADHAISSPASRCMPASPTPQHFADRDGDRHRDRHHATSAPQTINITVNEQADAPTLSARRPTPTSTRAARSRSTSPPPAAEADQAAPTVTITGFPADATLTNTARRHADDHGRQHHADHAISSPASRCSRRRVRRHSIALTVTATDTETDTARPRRRRPSTSPSTSRPTPRRCRLGGRRPHRRGRLGRAQHHRHRGGGRPGRPTVTIAGFPADATLTNTARRPAHASRPAASR